MITIRSLHPGFRRAGIAHGTDEKAYPNDFFKDEQIEALVNEPMLLVSIDDEEPGDADQEDVVRKQRLIVACGGLDKDTDNHDHWTRSKSPQTEALEKLSGEEKVTAAERDEAYAFFLKLQDGE